MTGDPSFCLCQKVRSVYRCVCSFKEDLQWFSGPLYKEMVFIINMFWFGI